MSRNIACFKYLFIHLVAPSLSYGAQHLGSSLQQGNQLVNITAKDFIQAYLTAESILYTKLVGKLGFKLDEFWEDTH